jgi:hypothetical protein
MQDGKLAHTSFPPHWDDVISDELMLVQEGKLDGGMMLSEMSSWLCKR